MASQVPDDFLRSMEDATEALEALAEAATSASESAGQVGGGGGPGGGGVFGGGKGFGLARVAKLIGVGAAMNLGRRALVDSFNTSADFGTALTANLAESFVNRTGFGRNTLDPINRAAQRTIGELGEAAQFGELPPELIREVQDRNRVLEENRQKLIAEVGGNRLGDVRDAAADALAPLLDRLIGLQIDSNRLLGDIARQGGGGGH